MMLNRDWGSTAVRTGFAIVAAGAVIDIGYHLAPRPTGAAGWAGLAGHLVTFLGMVIVMAGIFGVGLRRRHT